VVDAAGVDGLADGDDAGAAGAAGNAPTATGATGTSEIAGNTPNAGIFPVASKLTGIDPPAGTATGAGIFPVASKLPGIDPEVSDPVFEAATGVSTATGARAGGIKAASCAGVKAVPPSSKASPAEAEPTVSFPSAMLAVKFNNASKSVV